MPLDKDDHSKRFVEGMRARTKVSLQKYGPAEKAFPHKVDAIKTARTCIAKYEATGNSEYLMDAANYLMFEFELPALEGAHFTPTDSDQSAGRIWGNGGAPKHLDNQGERVR